MKKYLPTVLLGVLVGVCWWLAGVHLRPKPLPPAPEAPYVKLPAEFKADAGTPFVLTAETNGHTVRWRFIDPGLAPVPLPWSIDDTATAYLSGKTGRYRVLAWTALDDVPSEAALCTVILGAPGPGPVPPGPAPVPPGPVDPLFTSVQLAYSLEADPAKAKEKADLAGLYRAAATASGNASLKTWGDLWKVMSDTANSLGLRGKLPGVDKAIQGELSGKLPKIASAPLDAAGRDLAARTFGHVADALDHAQ